MSNGRIHPISTLPGPVLGSGMIEVILDIEEGTRIETGATGAYATRKGLIRNVPGVGVELLVNGLQARGVPHYGDPFSANAPSLTVSRVTGALIPGLLNAIDLLVEYGTPEGAMSTWDMTPDDDGPPRVELLTTAVQVETNKDRRGQLLIVRHITPGSPPVEDRQVATVTKLTPSRVLRYYRRETTSPDYRARMFVGKVNSNQIADDGAGYWLCTALNGDTDDGGMSWRVTYEFQRHPDGWFAHVYYVDPTTGRLPVDAVEGQDIVTYELYDQADFNALHLML